MNLGPSRAGASTMSGKGPVGAGYEVRWLSSRRKLRGDGVCAVPPEAVVPVLWFKRTVAPPAVAELMLNETMIAIVLILLVAVGVTTVTAWIFSVPTFA